MAKKKKIGLVLALDGEKEFTKSVSDINKTLKVLDSELKKSAAEYAGQANTIQALTSKQEILTKTLDAQRQKQAEIKKGLDNANTAYEKSEKRLEKLSAALKVSTQKQDEMKKSGTASAKELADQAEKVRKLSDAVTKQEGYVRQAENRVKTWEISLNNADAAVIRSTKNLNENTAYLKEAEYAIDGCASSIDNFGKRVEDTNKSFSFSFSDKLSNAFVDKGVDIAVDALRSGVEAVKESMYDLSGAASQLTASTGLSEAAAERYRNVMKEIKGDNFGEDYQDIADSMAQVIQVMGELDNESMKNVTESAITLRDTFGMDVNESIRAVDVMVKTMGVDAQEAFDLIAAGAQNGLNRSGELTDNLIEYASLWGQAGFSAQEMFGILENGLNAGAYNLDKVNDYAKEFGNSLADGRIEENLEAFSGETKDLFQKWKDGEASTKDVFQSVIEDLSEMENQQEALTLASNVWSSLGEDNAMQVITALDDVNDAYANVYGTMESIQDIKYDSLESAVSGLGAAVQENILTPIAEKALPVISGALEGITNLIDPPKTKMEEFSDEVASANEEIASSLENARSTMDSAQLDAEKITLLGQQLISLNSVEEKSLAQKYQLREVVAELGQYIPEIAAAYDGETDSMNATNTELLEMINNTKQLMIAQAAQAAGQEVMNSLLEAQIQLDNAKEIDAQHRELIDTYREQAEALEKINAEFDPMAGNAEELDKRLQEITGNTEATVNDIPALLDVIYGAMADEEAALAESSKQTEELKNNIEGLEEEQNRIAKSAQELADTYSNNLNPEMETLAKNMLDTGAGMEEAIGPLKDAGDAAEETVMPYRSSAEMLGALADAQDDAGKSAEDMSESLEETGDAAEDAAEKIRDAAELFEEAQTGAVQHVLDAYKTFRDEAENSLSFDFMEGFDGGYDDTVENMIKSSEEQIEALQNYEENLALIRDHLGNEITPEFLQYLEDLGLEGANALEHIAITFEQDNGSELIKEWCDNYMDTLDIQDRITDVLTGDKVALENGLKDLGSTDAEWNDLVDAFYDVVSEIEKDGELLSEEYIDAFRNAIETAKEIGVQIPEGLIEGLNSGEIGVEGATSSINGAIQGQLEGLLQAAQESGVAISEEIAKGIESGTVDPETAYAGLLEAFSSAGATAAENAASSGTDAGESYASGMEGASESASSAAGALKDAAISELEAADTDFETAGSGSGESFADGLSGQTQTAAQAAGEVASAGASQAKLHKAEYYNAGSALAAGIAEGITAGKSGVVGAARSAVAEAVQAAKEEGDIHSPSRKMKREVGIMLASGAAEGLRDGTQEVVSDAADMVRQAVRAAEKETAQLSGKMKGIIGGNFGLNRGDYDSAGEFGSAIYDAADTKLEHKQILGDVDMEYQLAYWEKVQEQIEKTAGQYSDAWYKVEQAIQDAEEGIKEAEQDAYDAIVSAAETYVERKRLLNGMSAADEAAYWKQIREELEKGTDAWYDATEKMLDAQEEAAEEQKAVYESLLDDAEDYVEKKQFFNRMSAEDEANYWRDIRNQLESEGGKYTDEWYKITQKIRDAKEQAAQDQEEAYGKLLSDSENYVERKKFFNKMSTEEEESYWRKIRSQLESEGGKYTDEWYEITQKIRDAKEQAAQDEKDEAAERLASLEDQMRKRKILNDVSVSEELAYWEKELNGFKAYTDEWYTIMETIKNLREQKAEETKNAAEEAAKAAEDAAEASKEAAEEAERAAKEQLSTRASVQDKLLSNYKTYYKVSAQAEVDYWNICRQQFSVGTQERIDADQKYFDAKQELYDQLEELDNDYAEQTIRINDTLTSNIDELTKAYEDAVESRKNEIASSMNLFEKFESTGYDGDTLLYNLETQVAGLALWEQQLDELSKKGLSEGLLEELREMGPDAAASIYSLNQMTEEQLKRYDDLWNQKMELAGSQAVKENEELRTETLSQIEKLKADARNELADLTAEYTSARNEITAGISSSLVSLANQARNAGEDVVAQLIAGIREKATAEPTMEATKEAVTSISNGLGSLEPAGKVIGANTLNGILEGLKNQKKIDEASKDLANTIAKSIKASFGINSPSKLMEEEIGVYIPAGIGRGIERGTQDALDSVDTMMQGILDGAQRSLSQKQAALQEKVNELARYDGMSALNRMTETSLTQQTNVTVNQDGVLEALGRMSGLIESLIERMGSFQVVLDTGTLAGEMREQLDHENGMALVRRNRGRY